MWIAEKIRWRNAERREKGCVMSGVDSGHWSYMMSFWKCGSVISKRVRYYQLALDGVFHFSLIWGSCCCITARAVYDYISHMALQLVFCMRLAYTIERHTFIPRKIWTWKGWGHFWLFSGTTNKQDAADVLYIRVSLSVYPGEMHAGEWQLWMPVASLDL